MLKENLKQKSLHELLDLLKAAQRNLELSTMYKQGANVVQRNKIQLEKVQQAIVDKRDPSLQQKITS